MTLQAEYHAHLDQTKLAEACRRRGVILTAYCPLGRGRLLRDPVLADIAAHKGRPLAQIALRWLIQQGNVVPIPRSSNPKRMAENMDVFDFALSDDEMKRIARSNGPTAGSRIRSAAHRHGIDAGADARGAVDDAMRGAQGPFWLSRPTQEALKGVTSMAETPKYFMYFPGNYRWSAAFVNMLGRGSYGGADISELHQIGRLLEGKSADDDEAWFDACVRVADDGARARRALSRIGASGLCRGLLSARVPLLSDGRAFPHAEGREGA